ncbi:hypothetical protein L7F22_034704 [Adiantum nelumboides]|nr:hypothetical protein [Adiantum nelumboides]
MQAQGFTRLISDASVYIRNSHNAYLILALYVDDILLMASNMILLMQIKQELSTAFRMTDGGDLSYILGMEIRRHRPSRTLHLSQKKFAGDILGKFHLRKTCTCITPLPSNYKAFLGGPKNTKSSWVKSSRASSYRSMLGSIRYLITCTRPDIAFASGLLSRFMHNPSQHHALLAARLLHYIAQTKNLGITFGKHHSNPLCVEGYSDADWASEKETCLSTGGYIFTLSEGAVSWKSKRQQTVSLSSCEAEYKAVTDAAKEALWLGNLLEELGVKSCKPHQIFCDSSAAIDSAKKPRQSEKLKHMNIAEHFIREQELETLVLQNMGSGGDFPTLEMPRELKSLRKLVTLSLVWSQFGGPIPMEWSEITTLQHLNLSLNWQINGTIPASLCKLQSLQTLWLSNSFIQGSLTGSIPSCFGSLIHLTGIDLSNNQLKGSIPSELGNLINLRNLRLSNNMMSGTIPSSLGKLTQLQYLHLQGNTFTGQIPPSLGNLVNLREARVSGSEDDSGNLVSLSKGLFGRFPPGIGGRALRVLRIRGTSISGPLPTSLGLTNKNLREVVLDNNAFTGTIPESFGAPKKLVTLNLASNRLQGQIPSLPARSKSKLKSIDLSRNLLTGSIPSSFSGLSLSSLDLSHNRLNGSIPVHLGNALLFGVLDLGSNCADIAL